MSASVMDGGQRVDYLGVMERGIAGE